jgi:hypothetical protein
MRLTSKWHFVSGLLNGSLEIPKVGTFAIWGPITLCTDLQLRWGLKQSCNPCQELSKGLSHTTYAQWIRGDSRCLVVRSQIANLTPNLSLGHNLCFNCSNGLCKPILDIYVSIAFQWYKKILNAMNFDPYNRSLEIWESIGTPTPTFGLIWECEGSFSHTLLRSWEYKMCFLGLPLVPHSYKPLPWSWAQG